MARMLRKHPPWGAQVTPSMSTGRRRSSRQRLSASALEIGLRQVILDFTIHEPVEARAHRDRTAGSRQNPGQRRLSGQSPPGIGEAPGVPAKVENAAERSQCSPDRLEAERESSPRSGVPVGTAVATVLRRRRTKPFRETRNRPSASHRFEHPPRGVRKPRTDCPRRAGLAGSQSRRNRDLP